MREPLGVVAGITPPNYPLTMPLYKAAPALATGNTIILKPSEDTSLVALRLAEIFLEAGLPEGVFNVVTGFGETAGAALAAPRRRRQDHLHRLDRGRPRARPRRRRAT